MPNLRAIIEAIEADDRFTPFIDEYVLWVYILFGVLNDAPGLIWVPGKGPVPVDPQWKTIAKEQHALLVKSLESEAAHWCAIGEVAVRQGCGPVVAERGEGDRRQARAGRLTVVG